MGEVKKLIAKGNHQLCPGPDPDPDLSHSLVEGTERPS